MTIRANFVEKLGEPLHEEQIADKRISVAVFKADDAFLVVMMGTHFAAVTPKKIATMEAALKEVADMKAGLEKPEVRAMAEDMKRQQNARWN